MLEQFHRTLKTVIAKLDDPTQWKQVLDLALFACRDTPHAATGHSPFELLFGWEVKGPDSLYREVWTQSKKTPVNVISYLAISHTREEISCLNQSIHIRKESEQFSI